MADRSWFFAAQGQQQGPYPEAQLRDFIASGTITPQTLVWSEGMAGWQKAGDVPSLLAGASGPPVLPHPGLPPTIGGSATGQSVSADFGIWELLGRSLIVLIGTLLVVPAPWTTTSFYRWFVQHVRIPQRPNAVFTGSPGDIWWAFVILALGTYAGWSGVPYLQYMLLPVQGLLSWVIVRWFVARISPDGQQCPLTFTGSAWAYVGWYLLGLISFITIIGWAWVLTAWMRWICRNIAGTRRQIIYNASGWQMLWRTLLFSVGMVLIIPIPWALAWYARWGVAQFALVQRTA